MLIITLLDGRVFFFFFALSVHTNSVHIYMP
jgi:hypothetical protein